MKNDVTRLAARHGLGHTLGIAVALALLSSCGGGGSSSTPTPPPNQAPAFTSGGIVSFVEDAVGAVYQATASDADGDTVTFKIAEGADAAHFAISAAGRLSFVAPPNFDLPGDANGDNVYEVQIIANDGRASNTLMLAVTVTNSKEGIAVRRVGTGFTNPVAVAPINDWTILVAEKNGAIYRLDRRGGPPTLFAQVNNVGGIGVLAMTLGPDFALVGNFYVMYTTTTGFLVVEEFFSLPAFPRDPAVPSLYGPLLNIPAPQYAGGGWLGIDTDYSLLIATGDAGGRGDPSGSAQDNSSNLGKVLRATRNPDPFAGASPVFYLFSTIAQGLHRPNGGFVYAGGILLPDSGQDVAEEINYLGRNAGIGNFGWPFKEGTAHVFGTPPNGLIDPVIEYPRGAGARAGLSIVGGAVGGSAIPSLSGQYIFADRGGAIFTIPADSIQQGRTLAASLLERRDADFAPDSGAINRPVAVTAGPNGVLYVVDDDGDIFRVDPS
ncbi:PQQ-dependent sugar dehydrogenase [Allosphingosinicella humi]